MGTGRPLHPCIRRSGQSHRYPDEDGLLQPDRQSDKTFTITGVLQLADQGKLGLDDPIAKYIDGVPEGDRSRCGSWRGCKAGWPTTPRQTSFSRRFSPTRSGISLRSELLDYAFAEPMKFQPGEGFLYCNTNTVLLGLVVEKISGQTLPDYIRDHITTPLGMSHTSFPTDNAFPEPHAQGYTTQIADNSETTATDWNPSWGWAAGAMISTLEDMHIWAPALATGKLLTPEMQPQRLQTVDRTGHAGRRTDTAWESSTSAAGSDTTAACPATRPSRSTCRKRKRRW